jgi:Lon protease-like protein
MAERTDALPLFPLGLVALPTEIVPLHVFEPRYRSLVAFCLEHGSEFGIVWAAEDGDREVGCAMRITEVLERFPDGRTNVLTRGTRPFRVLARREDRAFPAGDVEWLEDRPETPDEEAAEEAREAYRVLVREAADRELEDDELQAMDAFAMAATVDFGLEAKQGLLELRSETARLRLVTRLLLAATKRLDFIERAQARARSNGKVRFG